MKSTIDLYRETLTNFKNEFQNHRSYKQKQFLTFDYELGSNFNNGLIFYGRALAGQGYHTPNWNFDKDIDEQIKIIQSQRDRYLDWAKEEWHNGKIHGNRSIKNYMFWQAFHRIYCNLYGSGSDSWLDNIAWSNLYKISPVHGKNPSLKQQRVQLPGVRKLFRSELKNLSPQYAILATGLNWAKPFLDFLEVELIKHENPSVNGVVGVCTYNATKIIVTKRPDNRKKGATLNNYVTSVMETIKA